MANGTPMGRTVTASSDRRTAERTVPPSGWEHEVRDRVVAGDDAALREVYDQYSSFVYGLARARDRRHARRRGRQPGRLRRVLGAPRCVRSRPRQPPDLAGHPDPPPRRRPRAPRGGAPPSRRARRESRPCRSPTSRRWRPRSLAAERVRAALELLPPDQRGRSSSRTSAGRPTARSRRRSASPREPPSRDCAWRCGGSPMPSKPKEMSGERRTGAEPTPRSKSCSACTRSTRASPTRPPRSRRCWCAGPTWPARPTACPGGGVDRRRRGDATSAAHAGGVLAASAAPIHAAARERRSAYAGQVGPAHQHRLDRGGLVGLGRRLARTRRAALRPRRRSAPVLRSPLTSFGFEGICDPPQRQAQSRLGGSLGEPSSATWR